MIEQVMYISYPASSEQEGDDLYSKIQKNQVFFQFIF